MPDHAARLSITLAGMRFNVRVGILPHEREVPQPLEVDLSVRRGGHAVGVLDYRLLYAVVRDVIEAEPLDYLETVAGDIARGVMSLDGVAGVRVAVRKPHVALGGPLAHAEVVVEQGS
ncbi:MAG TPA: dihydroneopterin aldolase [Gemmatimonadaceae bacterium]|nr:dihydroneopterin aldolase [Gemmatimonadaceae bacterium]